MAQRLKYKTWDHKLLQENTEEKTSVSLGSEFLDKSPKAQATQAKRNKWDCIKPKSFFTEKETTNKLKRWPTEWEKIFFSCLNFQFLNFIIILTMLSSTFYTPPKYSNMPPRKAYLFEDDSRRNYSLMI